MVRGIELSAEPEFVPDAVSQRRGGDAHQDRGVLHGLLEVGHGKRQFALRAIGSVGAVEPDWCVEVHRGTGLELHDLGEGHLRPGSELSDRETTAPGEPALQSDQEPAPQLVGVELPHHMGEVVVALRAQRFADAGVGSRVSAVAPQRPTMRTDRLGPPRPAQPASAGAVDGTERRSGQGDERARPLRHRLGDALPADETAGQDVPGVALVLLRARGADGGAAVAAADVGGPVELLG
jgi:hypothetical protein